MAGKTPPAPKADLEAGPQPQAHFPAVADIHVAQSFCRVDFVPGGDRDSGTPKFPRKTRQMDDQIAVAPLRRRGCGY